MADIYIAAAYGRRREMLWYAQELREAGHTITSTWLDGKHEELDAMPGERAQEFALADLDDLMDADMLLTFTEPPESTASRGGRHVEYGIALRAMWWRSAEAPWTKMTRIIVVGPRENVFRHLPEVEQYETWDEARAALAPVEASR